ncbi:DNA helicase RecQ [Feifania hominis]|uniref:DNA helicase RecQ n=1 Tax=Feifania hominis TaxID=2763660 RepID=UPI00201638C1
MDELSVLKEIFGYQSFRAGQSELIAAVRGGRDALGIMPTGAGKSICYQVPALLFSGITLVVSPLISLMKDQVGALRQAGVAAAFLNSSLTSAQFLRALQNAEAGEYKIIYVAPERLLTDSFLRFAVRADISMVTVDEAHCVSQWGQDFRPSYLKIPEFLEQLPRRPVVSAFTATATAQVREDIVAMLGLRDPAVVTTGFDRPNLYFEVQRPPDKFEVLYRYLGENPDRSGIVYCATRKTVEEVCGRLQRLGVDATRYHAGLEDEERERNQDDFLYDRARVMVATNAFGMGIDKSNVGFVIHYNMPKNMESYYQEAGRAGRDGSAADCILLYSGQDVVTNRYFIDHASENEELDAETLAAVRERDLERLRQMTFYCTVTTTCLRAAILGYFGEQAPAWCGNCSSCLAVHEQTDVTETARRIVDMVARSGGRYGIGLIVDALRGSAGRRVSSSGLFRQPSYGTERGRDERELRVIIDHLLAKGYLYQTEGEYPVLRPGERARELMQEGEFLFVELPEKAEARQPRGKKRRTAWLAGEDHDLFERLRRLRARLAASQGVPAYAVFTDATLHEMARSAPRSPEELLEVPGVGHAKLARYGKLFLGEIADYIAEGF